MQTKTLSTAGFMSGGDEMGKLMRGIDWSTTALGAVEQWPQSLRTSVSTCINSRFPILLWWGPEMVMLYNDAYRPILGLTKHPAAMGQRGKECWPEIWHIIGPMLEGVLSKGEATWWSENQMLPVDRNGYVEECYFTFSFSPIQSEHGIGGIFTAVYETTQQVIAQRRLDLLRRLGEKSLQARSVEAACGISGEVLKDASHDIPYALIYLYAHDEKRFVLCKNIGIESAALAPQYITVSDDPDILTWPLASVLEARAPYVWENADQLSESLPGTPWTENSTTAVLLPLTQPGAREIAGVLIAGISPRHRVDHEYLRFLTLVAGQITITITNANAHEEERKREEALAEIVRAQTKIARMRDQISAQLRHVFEQTPAAIAIVRRDDYVLEFANRTYLRIIDRAPACVGHPLFEVLPQLRHQGIRELLDGVVKTGQSYLRTEFEVDLHGNGKRYCNFIYHPLKDEDDRISGVIVVCFDVTDLVTAKRRAEESELLLEQKVRERTAQLEESHQAMRQQRDFVEKILNSSVDNICVFDHELRYIGFNQKSEETYNKSKEEVLGKGVLEVYPDMAGTTFHSALQQALTGIPGYDQDYQSLVTGRHFEINFIPLYDQWKKVYAVLVIAHDNTGAIEAAKTLEEKNEQLSKTNLELERFAYVASHDLQEPLRKIRTFSSLIERDMPVNVTASKYFQKIHASSARMSDLIKDLLDYSRVSASEVVPQRVNLQDILAHVISDYDLLIEETGARVRCGNLPVVKGTAPQLQQLFTNLIGNALKFSRKEPLIEVSSRAMSWAQVAAYFPNCHERDYAEVTVRDNGIGFDQQFSEQIFTIFHRLHDRKITGTGIGLAICRKIVENHHGFIRAEGKVGEGAVFYIYLPV